MSIYDDLRNASNDLHAEFAQGTVRYIGLSVASGARPDAPASTSKSTGVAVNAVVRSVSTRYVDGTNVFRTDKQVSVSNDGVTPTPVLGHFIRIDGVDHKIVMIMARPDAGVPVSWTLIVRK